MGEKISFTYYATLKDLPLMQQAGTLSGYSVEAIKTEGQSDTYPAGDGVMETAIVEKDHVVVSVTPYKLTERTPDDFHDIFHQLKYGEREVYRPLKKPINRAYSL